MSDDNDGILERIFQNEIPKEVNIKKIRKKNYKKANQMKLKEEIEKNENDRERKKKKNNEFGDRSKGDDNFKVKKEKNGDINEEGYLMIDNSRDRNYHIDSKLEEKDSEEINMNRYKRNEIMNVLDMKVFSNIPVHSLKINRLSRNYSDATEINQYEDESSEEVNMEYRRKKHKNNQEKTDNENPLLKKREFDMDQSEEVNKENRRKKHKNNQEKTDNETPLLKKREFDMDRSEEVNKENLKKKHKKNQEKTDNETPLQKKSVFDMDRSEDESSEEVNKENLRKKHKKDRENGDGDNNRNKRLREKKSIFDGNDDEKEVYRESNNTKRKNKRRNPREDLDSDEFDNVLSISKCFKNNQVDKSMFKDLPILKIREEYLDRLKDKRFLVVTAHTGSGKTTQLPQYTGSDIFFKGKTICTQPRALAASSIAKRISKEYQNEDKCCGDVGYSTSLKTVQGKRIMLYTDRMLIYKATKDPLLSDVSVLIIDEAHERSLNTDIVVGIAKTLLLQRKDFYVVVASATIDPKPFLDFFEVDSCSHLEAEGKVYPIEEISIPMDLSHFHKDNVKKLVEQVKNQLKKNITEGHTLVFLPGQNEIKNCIDEFSSFEKKHQNFKSYPLYSGISGEEQQKIIEHNDPSERMVIFCTNIAETSLTVPNVQLVIDTGLAKESRFLIQTKTTILEQRYISKSSSNQRKGRAGRTCPGVCLRLYDFNELDRENIEPEIIRSSLDLVCLQLIALGFNPASFPLISQPDISGIESSISTLSKLGCISSPTEITEKGKLFLELPFEPRYSEVIYQGYLIGKSSIVNTMISIITSQNSIVFFDRKDLEQKDQMKEELKKYSSDLDFYYQLYQLWSSSTNQKSLMKDYNLVLKSLKSVSDSIRFIDKIMNSIPIDATSESRYIEANELEIMGSLLSSSFPELICQVLHQNIDSQRAKVLMFDKTFIISDEISLHSKDNLFFSAKITQVNEFITLSNMICPISKDYLFSNEALEIVNNKYIKYGVIYSKNNLNEFSFSLAIRDFLKQYPLCFHSFDRTNSTVNILGPSSFKDIISTKLDECIETRMKELFSVVSEKTLFNDLKITFQAGLNIQDIRKDDPPIIIPHETFLDQTDTKELLETSLKSDFEKVRSFFYSTRSKCIYVDLKDIQYKDVIKSKLQSTVESSGLIKDRNESLVTDLKVEINDQRFIGFIPSTVHIKYIHSHPSFFIPQKVISYDLSLFKAEIQRFSIVKNIKSKDQNNYLLNTIELADRFTLNEYDSLLNHIRMRCPKLSIRNNPIKAILCFKTPSDCIEFLNSNEKNYMSNIMFSKTISFINQELYDIEMIKRNLVKNSDETVIDFISNKVTISSPKLDVITSIWNSIRSLLKPLRIIFQRPIEKFVRKEFLDCLSHYKVKSECEKDTVRVYGSTNEKGLVFQRYMDLLSKYQRNEKIFPIKDRIKEMIKNLPKIRGKNEGYFIEIFQRSLHIIHRSRIEEKDIESIIKPIRYNLLLGTRCCNCESEHATSLSICGHFLCENCLNDRIQKDNVHVLCPRCQTRIHVYDILHGIRDDRKLNELLERSSRNQICISPQFSSLYCICSNCDSIQENRHGYYPCTYCNHCFCSICGVVDNDFHQVYPKDCAKAKEAEKSQDFVFEQIIINARKFIENNWPADVGPIKDISINGSINSGSKSIQRFCMCLSVEKMILKPSDIIYGWHGTSDNAFLPICFDGFDPSKRSGQACGPGEYFGIKLITSMGYNRGKFNSKNGQMILAAIINKQGITSVHGDFCYVVNNPIHWSYSYSLPLMAVTYGNYSKPTFILQNPPLKFSFSQSLSIRTSKPIVIGARWKWLNDSGNYDPYTEDANSKIEAHYQAFRSGLLTSVFIVEGIVRYVDDRPQNYIIDVHEMTQKNSTTMYSRKIERVLLTKEELSELSKSDHKWQFKDSCWVSYDFSTQKLIREAYENYIKGGNGFLVFNTPGRAEEYTINFASGYQYNNVTKVQREVRMIDFYFDEDPGEVIEFDLSRNLEAYVVQQIETNLINRLSSSFDVSDNDLSIESKNQRIKITLHRELRLLKSVIIGIFLKELSNKGIRERTPNLQIKDLDMPQLAYLLNPYSPIGEIVSRNDLIQRISHWIIWNIPNSYIYGGFVRDWVINKQEANDIDILIEDKAYIQKIVDDLSTDMKLKTKSEGQKGIPFKIKVSAPWGNELWGEISLDIVMKNDFMTKGKPPYIDCDVNNIIVSKDGIDQKLPKIGSTPYKLIDCITHCQKHEFVFFLNYEVDSRMYEFRLEKMLKKGFKCLSPIHPSLSTRSPFDRIRGQERYKVDWTK